MTTQFEDQETIDVILEDSEYIKKDLIAQRNLLIRNPKLVKDADEVVAGIDKNIVISNQVIDTCNRCTQTMGWRDKK